MATAFTIRQKNTLVYKGESTSLSDIFEIISVEVFRDIFDEHNLFGISSNASVYFDVKDGDYISDLERRGLMALEGPFEFDGPDEITASIQILGLPEDEYRPLSEFSVTFSDNLNERRPIAVSFFEQYGEFDEVWNSGLTDENGDEGFAELLADLSSSFLVVDPIFRELNDIIDFNSLTDDQIETISQAITVEDRAKINDFLYNARGGNDRVFLPETDTLPGGEKFETSALRPFLAGRGNDTIIGAALGDFVRGGDDNDIIIGGEGENVLIGDEGNDDLTGGDDIDRLFTGGMVFRDDYNSVNRANGGGGNDYIYGGGGIDVLHGGAGIDEVFGGDGDDVLYAGYGGPVDPDEINGGHRLVGGGGSDSIYSWTSDTSGDSLTGDGDGAFARGSGGSGASTRGNDTFFVNDNDRILDFEAGDIISALPGVRFGKIIAEVVGSETFIRFFGDNLAENSNIILDGAYSVGGFSARVGGNEWAVINWTDSSSGLGKADALSDRVAVVGATIRNRLISTGVEAVSSEALLQAYKYESVITSALRERLENSLGPQSLSLIKNSVANLLVTMTKHIYGAFDDYSEAEVRSQYAQALLPVLVVSVLGTAGVPAFFVGLGVAASVAITEELFLSWTDLHFDEITEKILSDAELNLPSRATIWRKVTIGTDGNDDLSGISGANRIEGGAGDDRLVGADFDDILVGGNGDDRLVALDGADALSGGAGADRLLGGRGADRLVGGAGKDWLDGGQGVDRMGGGLGEDVYWVDHARDVMVEAPRAGTDLVRASVSHALTANVENLLLTGTEAINGTGNGLANVLIGNARANLLNGAAGNDRISGGLGSDRLLGAAGNDILDGGLGVDRMEGGLGNDVYVVDHVRDVAIEGARAGTDLVRSSVSFSLGANLENLLLTGAAALAGTGNAAANVLIGNAGANRLSGGGGADRLSGGLGIDALLGGASADDFVFTSAAAARGDRIGDFVRGQDQIDLRAFDADVTRRGVQDFHYVGSGSLEDAGDLRFAGGLLTGDLNGDGRGDFAVGVTGIVALSGRDFLL